MRAALPPGSPCGPASGWRIRPKGRAHDARAFVAVHGWTVNEPRNPIAQSAGRSPLTGPLGVSFLLVTSLWTSKEKLPARRDAGRTRTDAGRLSRRIRARRKRRTRQKHPRPTLSRKQERGKQSTGMRDAPTGTWVALREERVLLKDTARERKARRANPTNTCSAKTRNTPATPALRRRADAPVCPSRSTSTRRGVPTPAIPARSVRGRARR